jgi:predicted nucleic acid-binding protein
VIVVDASVIIHILLDGQIKPEIIERLESANGLMAPHLIDLEVMNAIKKQTNLKKMTLAEAESAFDIFNMMTIDRRPTYQLNVRIWELRQNLTPYDASYVALAEAAKLPLITRDGRLAKAPNLKTEVIVV